MSTASFYRVIGLILVMAALLTTPVAAQSGCFSTMARCFETTAYIESFWYRVWEALDCELGFISCVRVVIFGR